MTFSETMCFWTLFWTKFLADSRWPKFHPENDRFMEIFRRAIVPKQKTRTVENIADLSDAERYMATERFKIIEPHLLDSVPLTAISESTGVSYATIKRWVAAYKKHQLTGLVRKRRRRQRQIPQDMVEHIQGLYLRTRSITPAGVYRKIRQYCDDNNLNCPSRATIYNLCGDLDDEQVVYAKQGTKAFDAKYAPIRTHEATRSNELWQADHTEMDIWVLDEKKEAHRPWLTVIQDDHSRAIAGYQILLAAPSATRTSLALYRAISRKDHPNWEVCGIPEKLYTDNGSDFKSHHLAQVCAHLNIEQIYTLPGQPQGRGKIERIFNTVNQMLLSTLPGYSNQEGGKKSAKLTLSELNYHFKEWVLEYNNMLVPRQKLTRREKWKAKAFIPRLPDNEGDLDLLLLTVEKKRTVQRDGIAFQGLRYHHPNLVAFIGADVSIRYDPNDITSIKVFDSEGFICTAVCHELTNYEISLKELRSAKRSKKGPIIHEVKRLVEASNELSPDKSKRNEEDFLEAVRASKKKEPRKNPLLNTSIYEFADLE